MHGRQETIRNWDKKPRRWGKRAPEWAGKPTAAKEQPAAAAIETEAIVGKQTEAQAKIIQAVATQPRTRPASKHGPHTALQRAHRTAHPTPHRTPRPRVPRNQDLSEKVLAPRPLGAGCRLCGAGPLALPLTFGKALHFGNLVDQRRACQQNWLRWLDVQRCDVDIARKPPTVRPRQRVAPRRTSPQQQAQVQNGSPSSVWRMYAKNSL